MLYILRAESGGRQSPEGEITEGERQGQEAGGKREEEGERWWDRGEGQGLQSRAGKGKTVKCSWKLFFFLLVL